MASGDTNTKDKIKAQNETRTPFSSTGHRCPDEKANTLSFIARRPKDKYERPRTAWLTHLIALSRYEIQPNCLDEILMGENRRMMRGGGGGGEGEVWRCYMKSKIEMETV